MEQRQLVTFVNHFIKSTVTFLNDFMTHCEAKMMKSEQRLQKISASLCILETKVHLHQNILHNTLIHLIIYILVKFCS